MNRKTSIFTLMMVYHPVFPPWLELLQQHNKHLPCEELITQILPSLLSTENSYRQIQFVLKTEKNGKCNRTGEMSGKPAPRDGLVYLQCLFLCWALQASVNLFSVHVSLQNKSLSNNNFFQHENWQYFLKLQIVGCISGSFTSNKRKR